MDTIRTQSGPGLIVPIRENVTKPIVFQCLMVSTARFGNKFPDRAGQNLDAESEFRDPDFARLGRAFFPSRPVETVRH